MYQCPKCGEVYEIKSCPCVIMKYKNLQFPEQDYLQLVTLAKQAGFRVSRGRGSQLRLFVMTAANKACSGLVESSASQSESTPEKLSARQASSTPATSR